MTAIRFGGTHIINAHMFSDEEVEGLKALAREHKAQVRDYKPRFEEESGALVIEVRENIDRVDKRILKAVDRLSRLHGSSLPDDTRYHSSTDLTDAQISKLAGNIWDA